MPPKMSRSSENRTALSLYFHIPFCERKCPYCDFYSVVESVDTQKRFVAALLREIELTAERFPGSDFQVVTIFFGGGTPTVLPISGTERIVQAIRKHFAVHPEAEWTLEANPGTVDRAKFAHYRSLGFNRLSLGVQSFHDPELRQLGRIHTAREAEQAIQKAREVGFENINVDLIFGLPGQTLESWKASLEKALSLHPEHISTYNLIYEPDTPFGTLLRAGKLTPLHESVEWGMYRETDAILQGVGFRHYEISNFARPGKECRHNRAYWQGKSYLGFGPSAHSFYANHRWWNARNLGAYMENLGKSRFPPGEEETLTPNQRRLERIFLSLRQAEGLELETYERSFGENFARSFAGALTKLRTLEKETGPLLEESSGHLRLTLRGFWLSDSIFELFA